MKLQRDVSFQHEFNAIGFAIGCLRRHKVALFVLAFAVAGLGVEASASSPSATTPKTTASEPKAAPSEALLKDALDLTGQEGDAERAMRRLRARPRAQVAQAVREILAHPGTPGAVDVILRAVVSLELKEVAPEVRDLAEKSDYWRVIHTLNRVYAKDFENPKGSSELSSLRAFYLKRLNDSLPVPTKMALIDGLALMKAPIPKPLFRKLLEDPSYQVRQAAAQNFVVTRTVYATAEQLERFKWVFTTKPYQLRLDAMDAFGRMPASDRKALSSAVQPSLCEKEPNAAVQKACQDLLPKHSRAEPSEGSGR